MIYTSDMTKSRGVYVPRGTRQRWIAENTDKHLCQCGCGAFVKISTGRYPDPPRYLHGHNSRTANPNALPGGGREAWAAEQQGRHPCQCDCGEQITVQPHHYSVGIPRFLPHHGPKPRPKAPVTPPRRCACGCEQLTAAGSRYVHGHNGRREKRETFLAYTTPLDGNRCWPWTGWFNANGYAMLSFRTKQGRTRRAHRIAFELLRGPIPEGLELDHVCRNRGCVNPWHLDAVSHQENLRRRKLTPAAHRALGPARPADWTFPAA